MHFTFGAELAPWTHVGSIKIKNFDSKWCRVLEILRPAELTIEYAWEGGELDKFVPYPGLKKLDVTVPELLRVKMCESFFDFVKTPDLEFSVFVGNPCEYKFHIMGAWRALRKRLPIAFHDIDLAQFNVRQSDRTNAIIRSVKAGEKPRYQDHIPNARQDREDEELSEAYFQRALMKRYGISVCSHCAFYMYIIKK
ncbi:hypothetical protein EWM64_g6630 [Hericium alpestre]|uniref:Uncharacterized protein n=1 Tax=Hericium alpestre TaxID=135208 RepID=A0A4Y9ZRH6_9AGAM|nr:hypothetical protein EWM64_g6630 [Hericium alpestre]